MKLKLKTNMTLPAKNCYKGERCKRAIPEIFLLVFSLIFITSCNNSVKRETKLNIQVKINKLNLQNCKDRDILFYDFLKPEDFNKLMGNLYLADFHLINNTDSIIKYWIFRCSWDCNWITNNKFFRILGPSCVSNYPVLRQIKPGQMITYKGAIQIIDTLERKKINNFKIGFIISKSEKDVETLFFFHNQNDNDNKINNKDIIWSDPLTINF